MNDNLDLSNFDVNELVTMAAKAPVDPEDLDRDMFDKESSVHVFRCITAYAALRLGPKDAGAAVVEATCDYLFKWLPAWNIQVEALLHSDKITRREAIQLRSISIQFQRDAINFSPAFQTAAREAVVSMSHGQTGNA